MPTALLLAAKDGTRTLFQTFESTTVLRPALLTDRDGNTLTYARDSSGRLTRITDVHGRYTAFSYNAQGFLATMTDQTGRTVTYLYDANGRKTSETGPEGPTSYGYDALNRLTSVTFPNSGVKHYGYDAQGRVTHEDQDGKEGLDYVYGSSVTTVTDALGRKTAHAFVKKNGLPVETLMTDNAGKQISFAYDRNLNLTLQDDKRLGTDRNTRYGYDAFGNVTALTDPMGGVTSTTYENVFNQPTLITDPDRNSTTLGYNTANGDLTSVVSIVGGRSLTTSMVYDGQGHVTSITDPRNKTTVLSYDSNGQLHTVQDPMGRTTTMTRDSIGRVTDQAAPARTAGTFDHTQFAYDAASDLTDVTDPIGGLTHYIYMAGTQGKLLQQVIDADHRGTSVGTTFGYDSLGRITSVQAPGSPARTFTYNADGTLLTSVNARGQTTTYGYDNRARLISRQTPEGLYSYGYDDAGRVTGLVAPNGASETRVYDDLDRLTDSYQTIPNVPGSFHVHYAYDANGNRTSMTTPWGTFAYGPADALNRMTSVTDPGNRTFSFVYDDAGRRTDLNRSINVNTHYDYDDAGQLLDIMTTSGTVLISSVAYHYDNAGNRDKMTDAAGAHGFTYDGLNRLTGASHPAASTVRPNQESFGYDPVGNRTADALATAYTYDDANHIVSNSLYTFGHDADGNVTSKTSNALPSATTSYAYDSANQLVGVTKPDGSQMAAKYDASGRRIEKAFSSAQGGTRRHYVYDGPSILAIVDDSGSLIELFTNGPNIDEPLKMSGVNGELFYLADGLGSIRALMDASGTIKETVEYAAYGMPTFADVRAGMPVYSNRSWTESPFAFEAQSWDAETQTALNGARTVDIQNGRFFQQDPFGIFAGTNLFLFLKGNPNRFFDPDGADAKTEPTPTAPPAPQGFDPSLTGYVKPVCAEQLKKGTQCRQQCMQQSFAAAAGILGNASLGAALANGEFNLSPTFARGVGGEVTAIRYLPSLADTPAFLLSAELFAVYYGATYLSCAQQCVSPLKK